MTTDDAVNKTLEDPDEKENARQFVAFIKEYSAESDRAAVILVGARLEFLLGKLVEGFLIPNTSSTDELLDTDRALGTFSSRIHAAYRLGLIDAEFARALHIFRRLRNNFAHETVGNGFDHGPVRDRIKELAKPFLEYQLFRKMNDTFFKNKSPTAATFYSVAALLIGRLQIAANAVSRITVQNYRGYHLIPEEWKKNS